MIDLTKFKESHPDKIELGSFSEHELDSLKGKLSDEIIEFLRHEGKASYGNGFFKTVTPHEYHEIIDDWGLNGKECYAFMVTSLGTIIYYSNLRHFCLNPFNGTLMKCGKSFKLFMNAHLQADNGIIDDKLWHVFYLQNKPGLLTLKEDEIYAINPTLPEGGNPETSKYEVVKFKEHLHKLAELFDHTTTD